MLFDIFFEVGGQTAVDAASNFIFPIYEWVCDMATQFGGWWDFFAQAFESIVS